jgi:hypothetical protein
MKPDSILNFFLLFFVFGIIGGAMFGFMLALAVLAFIYNPIFSIIFSFIIFLFFIPGIWKQVKLGKFAYIIRKVFEAGFYGLLFSALFSLEEGIIPFSNFDIVVIYISLFLTIFPLTLFLILAAYYNNSWLYQEIKHIIKGMQLYGLLPEEDKEK